MISGPVLSLTDSGKRKGPRSKVPSANLTLAGLRGGEEEMDGSSGPERVGEPRAVVYRDPTLAKLRLYKAFRGRQGERAWSRYWAALKVFFQGGGRGADMIALTLALA
jgi:hypothetical protein